MTPQLLDHLNPVPDTGEELRLIAILVALNLIDNAIATRALIPEAARDGRLATHRRLLIRVSATPVDSFHLLMQQPQQQVLGVNVGCRDHRAVREAAVAIGIEVPLHTEMPLPAFAGLVYFESRSICPFSVEPGATSKVASVIMPLLNLRPLICSA